MRYINQVIQYIEYQPDGLSTGIFRRRVDNPHGFRLAHQEMINHFSDYCSARELMSEMAKYIRFSLHCGTPLRQQRREINRPILWSFMLLKGYVNYRLDLRKKNRLNKRATHA